MNEPLYNKPEEGNSNYIDNNLSGNQLQNPNQYQDNQLMPPDANPPPLQQNSNQDMVPPQEQPYYSLQNQTQIPINCQQNQPIPPPNQVYYAPPQIIQNPQPQPQPQPYYPPQQGIPPVPLISNNTTQNNGIYVQTQGIGQDNKYQNNIYKNYQNISQVNHRGISQKNNNTFYISPSFCSRCFPLAFVFIGIIVIIIGFVNYSEDPSYGPMIGGLIFFCIGLFFFIFTNRTIYFIMGPNSLTVVKRIFCTKKVYNFNPGELIRVDFTYRYGHDYDSESNHHYNITIIPSNGEVIDLYSISGNTFEFTLEEIDYFLYYINNHIQTNMRV